ncbi:type II toxin-antitoxin system RelE/ParE family toxin [Leuconostoc gelidum subsp. aenigmaticum]|nr:type II toxin-antitoxin system RelE/ParE family toxin [Leuconostoc gelidum]MBZ6008266.1 type II toxin-antitoxin system RelE/ParE family toxin [Leuconostoc gelidum subsp. aenigmaticum]
MYNVTFTKQDLKQLKKLDKFTQSTIYQWIVNNLDGTDNPRLHGKGLTANHSGQWRYRVGDYRVLANIIEDQIVIEIFTIGHRRDIY